jgi:hypothetical protein
MRGEYSERKLFEALFTLATGSGTLRERLAGAAQHLIGLSVNTAYHFPDEATARECRGIVEDLTIFEPESADEGRIDATTRNLIDHDAHAIAKRIVELYARVQTLNSEVSRQ